VGRVVSVLSGICGASGMLGMPLSVVWGAPHAFTLLDLHMHRLTESVNAQAPNFEGSPMWS
jgi:hypothetical protein